MARKNIKRALEIILNDYGNNIDRNESNAGERKDYKGALVWQESKELYWVVRKQMHDLVGGFDVLVKEKK